MPNTACSGPPRAASDRAAHRALHRGAHIGGVRVDELVEGHGDVGAEHRLDLHGPLRRQPVLGAVQVREERDAVIVDPGSIGETEDLEATRIGQDRSVPGHEPMQATQARDTLGGRAQAEVVRVAQDHLGARRPQIGRRQRLHRRLRPNRHELGRVNRPVRCENAPQPGAPDRRRLEGVCDRCPR
jgi:hypothetical protein